MTQAQLNAALDLMRRLPPKDVEVNLQCVIELVPDLTEDLLQSVDQPLQVARDKESGRDYLLCDYNRDGDSFRSPWSNKYDPPLHDGAVPSHRMRTLEVAANEIFDQYREMYFEGGVSSVYCWDLDEGFAACALFKKVGEMGRRGLAEGVWDSIHVLEVRERDGFPTAHYKLTTTVMLHTHTDEESGKVTLMGTLTRQVEQDLPVNEANNHLVNMGNMIQDLENKLRISIDQIYFGKSSQIQHEIRKNLSQARAQKLAQEALQAAADYGGKGAKV